VAEAKILPDVTKCAVVVAAKTLRAVTKSVAVAANTLPDVTKCAAKAAKAVWNLLREMGLITSAEHLSFRK
jgi:hypothetical protein